MKRRFPVWMLGAALLLAAGSGLSAQGNGSPSAEQDRLRPPPLYLQFAPAVSLPLGGSSSLFTPGGGMSATGGFRFPFFPPASVRLGLEYGYGPTVGAPTVSLVSAVAGLGIDYRFSAMFGVATSVDAGVTYCFLNPPQQFEGYANPYLKAGGALRAYVFSPDISIDAGAAFVDQIGLYTGLTPSAGATFALGRTSVGPEKQVPVERIPPTKPTPLEGAPGQPTLVIEKTEFDPLFPVFFKYYDDHPFGCVHIRNVSSAAVSGVKVSLFIKDFMNAPQELHPLDALAPGQSADVSLCALFSDRILSVTERTKVQAEISVSWTAGDASRSFTKVESLPVVDRNGMSWDDDRKAAPFVTAKDTPVMSFAKNVAGAVKGKGSSALCQNLCLAMALHEALNAYGIAYVVDPKSSYADFSAKKTDIDYLQFPRQTLAFKAGDCDDLSILNCALLESVGVETALITVPGHIFMAFALGMRPDEARSSFLPADNLIFMADETWVPVEITQIDGGFLKAWELGARQWRENAARKRASFYPLKDAWKVYEPVFFRGEDVPVNVPASDRFVAAFLQEQIRFIEQAIYEEAARLKAEIQRTRRTRRRSTSWASCTRNMACMIARSRSSSA